MSGSLMDAINQSQKVVRVFGVEINGINTVLYEVRLSNMGSVIKGALDFIAKDSAKHKRFCIIFNARHINQANALADVLAKQLLPFKNMFLSPRLHKFAIMVENFVKHRVVIQAFDSIFDETTSTKKEMKAATPSGKLKQEGKLRKYEYFGTPRLEIVRKWVLE